MIPLNFRLTSFESNIDCNCEVPWAWRSFPWPGVSHTRYLTGFLDISFKEGSLTDRNRFEPVGTEVGRATVDTADVWEVCVAFGVFGIREDLVSSYVKVRQSVSLARNCCTYTRRVLKSARLLRDHTSDTKAVFPEPLGPKRRKLRTAGDATCRYRK